MCSTAYCKIRLRLEFTGNIEKTSFTFVWNFSVLCDFIHLANGSRPNRYSTDIEMKVKDFYSSKLRTTQVNLSNLLLPPRNTTLPPTHHNPPPQPSLHLRRFPHSPVQIPLFSSNFLHSPMQLRRNMRWVRVRRLRLRRRRDIVLRRPSVHRANAFERFGASD